MVGEASSGTTTSAVTVALASHGALGACAAAHPTAGRATSSGADSASAVDATSLVLRAAGDGDGRLRAALPVDGVEASGSTRRDLPRTARAIRDVAAVPAAAATTEAAHPWLACATGATAAEVEDPAVALALRKRTEQAADPLEAGAAVPSACDVQALGSRATVDQGLPTGGPCAVALWRSLSEAAVADDGAHLAAFHLLTGAARVAGTSGLQLNAPGTT